MDCAREIGLEEGSALRDENAREGIRELGGSFWGRLYFKVQAPDGAEKVHSTFVAGSAKSPEAWAEFRAKYVDIPEADYRRVIGGAS